MATHAVDAVIHVNDPSGGGRKADVVLRPVKLQRLAELLGMQPGAATFTSRCAFAETLISGSNPEVHSLGIVQKGQP